MDRELLELQASQARADVDLANQAGWRPSLGDSEHTRQRAECANHEAGRASAAVEQVRVLDVENPKSGSDPDAETTTSTAIDAPSSIDQMASATALPHAASSEAPDVPVTLRLSHLLSSIRDTDSWEEVLSHGFTADFSSLLGVGGGGAKSCMTCHKRVDVSSCSRCSDCHMVIYCSSKCQRTHWRVHKHFCQRLQGARISAALFAAETMTI